MRDPRLEEARRRYREDERLLVGFKTNVEVSAKLALAERSVDAVVTARVKTLDSLIKKLIRKPAHDYASLSDKVGVRVITNDTVAACEVIRTRFHCLREEDKAQDLGVDRLGYPGIHLDIELRAGDPDAGTFIPHRLRAEIQVRTYAQHAWCEASHQFDYKNDAQEAIPRALRRRLMLTIGLLEMADLNLAEIATEMNALPSFELNRLLDGLEKLYFLLTSRPPDRQLSLTVLALLAPLYAGGPGDIEQRVQRVFEEKKPVLRQVFERNERMEEPRAALFFQPETLVVYELLERNPDALRTAWIGVLPEDELARLANEFGYQYDDLAA